MTEKPGLLTRVRLTASPAKSWGISLYLILLLGSAGGALAQPTVVAIAPPAGATLTNLTQIQVTFSASVANVNAADLLISGKPATGLSGGGAIFIFTFAQPSNALVQIAWASNHNIVDLGIPPQAFDSTAPGATWTYFLANPAGQAQISSPTNGQVFTGVSNIIVNAAVTSAFSITNLQLFANDELIGQTSGSPASLVWTNISAGPHSLKVVGYDSQGSAQTSAVVNVTIKAFDFLIRAGTEWKYLVTGSDPGSLWSTLTYDDGAWAQGAAELGYGDAANGRPETTQVGYGPDANNKNITTYFRQRFIAHNTSRMTNLICRLKRDDGAVVWLNGQRLYVDNITNAVVDYSTLAQIAADDGANFNVTNQSSAMLVEGTNVVAVEIHQESVTSSDISFDFEMVGEYSPMPTITLQPQNLIGTQGSVATFTISATGTPLLFYQWFKNGAVMPNATNAAVSLQPLALADSGSLFFCVVANSYGSVTSAVARLTVYPDLTPPICVSAGQTGGNYYQIKVRFSETMDSASTTNPANYTLSGALTLGSITFQSDGSNVVIHLNPTTPLQPNASYTLSISNVRDLALNPILTGTMVAFTSWPLIPGRLQYDYFAGLSPSVINLDATLLADPRYPDWPTATYYPTAFDSRTVFPDDSHDGYGALITGFFIPPVSGNYIFYLRSDEVSRLYLNPNGDHPAGKILLLEETGCCGNFSKLASGPQALTAGQRYYVEALHQEGAGSDYVQVAVKLSTDPTNPDSLVPIPGSYLAVTADPLKVPGITWANPSDIVYGTALGSNQLNATASKPGSFIYSPPSGTILSAGSNQVLTAIFISTGTNAPVTNTVVINVLKAPLTITANNTNKAYGAALPALTVRYAGFVLGETNTALSVQPSIITTANVSSPVGNYPITVSGASSPNYAITFVPGILTVKGGISVGTTTNLLTFDTQPTLISGWSSLSVGAAAGNITTSVQLDSSVQTLTAGAITTTLTVDTVIPPATAGLAQWNSVGLFLQTRPTGNNYIALMATLQNNSGALITNVNAAYDFGVQVGAGATPDESPGLYGYRVYYSLTGSAGSWTLIPQLSPGTIGAAGAVTQMTATLNLGSWTPGSALYLLWADDNGPQSSGGTIQEPAYTIDNFQLTPLMPPIIIVQPTQQTAIQGDAANLRVTVAGTEPLSYQWYFQETNAIVGANAATLTLNNVTTANAGAYTVMITNSLGSVTSAVVVLTVDVPPEAQNDSYWVNEDATLNGASVLANDSDLHGGAPGENNLPLRIVLVTSTTNGVLTLNNNDGTFTYNPNANYYGTDTFSYRAVDSLGATSAIATVSITVTPVNDAPTAAPDVLSNFIQGTGPWSLPLAPLLANDSPGPANEGAQALTIIAVSNAVGGTVALVGPNVVFTPTPNNYNGPASFTYTVQDNGQSGSPPVNDFKTATATISFAVVAFNQPPTATPDILSNVLEDSGPWTNSLANLLANDSPGPTNESWQTLTISAVNNLVGGTVAIVGTNVVFTPTPNFNGTASFGYTVQDNGQSGSPPADDFKASATIVSFTVMPVNDAPTLAPINNVTSNENCGPIFVNLSGIGAGPGESQTLTILARSSHPGLIPDPTVNYTSPNASGTLSFTPVANASGTATITVIVSDNGGTVNGGMDKATNSFAVVINQSPNVVAWGVNYFGQTILPNDLTNAVAIAAGYSHGLAVRADGTVVAWGDNYFGQTNVPSGLNNVAVVAAGYGHNLVLNADGTVVAWGDNSSGQTNVPVGLSNVVAVAAGHAHSLALKADGAVVAWGLNLDGETTILPDAQRIVAVAAGSLHSLALMADGTVLAWGYNSYGQAAVPAGLSNVVAIAAGDNHSLALKADGTVAAWGDNFHGQSTTPMGLSNVVAIAAGYGHSLALRSDGRVVAWGDNDYGESEVPAGLSQVIGVSAGFRFSLALHSTRRLSMLSQPRDWQAFQGEDLLFWIGAAGPEQPISYQWYKNSQAIPGGTNAWLTLPSLQFNDQGIYTAVVRNSSQSLTNAPAQLRVEAPMRWLQQPAATIAVEGYTATFQSQVFGLEPMRYQWYHDDVAIPGATAATLTLAAVSTKDAGHYLVEITNRLKQIVSEPAKLTVLQNPRIIAQPQGGKRVVGETMLMNVEVTGTPPFGFEWRLNGVPIVPMGQGSNLLVLTNVQPAQQGVYTVVVTNAALPGGIQSLGATLEVWQIPVLIQHPAATNVLLGQTLFLCAAAEGTPPLRYQWRKNGANLEGATSACLTITNLQASDGGSYSVSVANESGVATSLPAEVIVQVPIVVPGDNFADRVFISGQTNLVRGTNTWATREEGEPKHANKAGTNSVWYTWQAPQNGIVTFSTIGSTFDTLLAVYQGYQGAQLTNLTLVVADEDKAGFFNSRVQFNAVAGQFYIIAIDGFAGDHGEYILGWLLEPTADEVPIITNAPVSQTVGLGSNATFTVLATGTGLRYQWYHNGQPLPDTTNATLVLINVQVAHVGAYEVQVANVFNRSTRSAPAALELGDVPQVLSVDKLEDLPGGSARSLVKAQVIKSDYSVSAGTVLTHILNNYGSQTQKRELDLCNTLGGASRELLLTAPTNGLMVIDTLNSEIDTVISVFGGDLALGVAGLTNLACDDNGAPDGIRSLVRFPVQKDAQYVVHVDGVSGAEGIVYLNWGVGVGPWDDPQRQPLRIMAQAGHSLPLTSPVSLSAPPPTYQWWRDGVGLAGMTNVTLMLNDLGSADSGQYSVVVSNRVGVITSIVAQVQVEVPLNLVSGTALDKRRLDLVIVPGRDERVVLQSSPDLRLWHRVKTNAAPGQMMTHTVWTTNAPIEYFRCRPQR